jgi:hypothetical protein
VWVKDAPPEHGEMSKYFGTYAEAITFAERLAYRLHPPVPEGPREFVVFDKDGNEIDSVDPYVSHTEHAWGLTVNNHWSSYPVFIPVGGRYEIREMRTQ